MLLSLLASLPAVAADCAAPTKVDQLLGELVTVEGALRTGDNASAGSSATTLEGTLGCLAEPLPRMIAGRTLRAVGAGHVAGGQTDRGMRWLRTAAEIEQSYEFGIEDLPANHPVRAFYADAVGSSSGDEVGVAGKTLAPGTAYLDGRKVTDAKARDDRFHVFQFDGGAGLRTWVIDGHAFPVEALVAGGGTVAAATPTPEPGGKPPKPAKEPKPGKEPNAARPKPEPAVAVAEPEPEPRQKEPKVSNATPKPGPTGTVVIDRKRPWEKTPLMVGGGVIGLGAGVLWYLSYDKRQEFEDANTLSDLEALQPQVNRLFIASVAVLGVGAGTFTWGVILDGGTPLPSLSVRF